MQKPYSAQKNLIKLFVLLLGIIISPYTVSAAEIENGIEGVCKKTLRGNLEAGDTEKLKNVEPELFAGMYGDMDFSVVRICLDSNGGSFVESLALAKFLTEQKIGTVVADGDACLSACAIAFMFGTAHVIDVDGVINRNLHKNAKLGFHRPSIHIPKGNNYTAQELEKVFSIAMESNQALLAMAGHSRPQSSRPFMDGDLIEQMLKHEGDNFYYIDTINKAGRWDINVIGFEPPALGEKSLYYACQNMTAWAKGFMHHQIPFEEAGTDWVRFSSENNHSALKDGMLYKAQFVTMLDFECSAGSRQWFKGVYENLICGRNDQVDSVLGSGRCNSAGGSWSGQKIPDIAMLPAELPLPSIPN